MFTGSLGISAGIVSHYFLQEAFLECSGQVEPSADGSSGLALLPTRIVTIFIFSSLTRLANPWATKRLSICLSGFFWALHLSLSIWSVKFSVSLSLCLHLWVPICLGVCGFLGLSVLGCPLLRCCLKGLRISGSLSLSLSPGSPCPARLGTAPLARGDLWGGPCCPACPQ